MIRRVLRWSAVAALTVAFVVGPVWWAAYNWSGPQRFGQIHANAWSIPDHWRERVKRRSGLELPPGEDFMYFGVRRPLATHRRASWWDPVAAKATPWGSSIAVKAWSYGVPFRSARTGTVFDDRFSPSGYYPAMQVDAIELSLPPTGWYWWDRRFAPFRPEAVEPLWFGLTANTLLSAALAITLVFGPGRLRRWRRRRRGRCVECNYDLRGAPERQSACPECASPILRSAGSEASDRGSVDAG